MIKNLVLGLKSPILGLKVVFLVFLVFLSVFWVENPKMGFLVDFGQKLCWIGLKSSNPKSTKKTIFWVLFADPGETYKFFNFVRWHNSELCLRVFKICYWPRVNFSRESKNGNQKLLLNWNVQRKVDRMLKHTLNLDTPICCDCKHKFFLSTKVEDKAKKRESWKRSKTKRNRCSTSLRITTMTGTPKEAERLWGFYPVPNAHLNRR